MVGWPADSCLWLKHDRLKAGRKLAQEIGGGSGG